MGDMVIRLENLLKTIGLGCTKLYTIGDTESGVWNIEYGKL